MTDDYDTIVLDAVTKLKEQQKQIPVIKQRIKKAKLAGLDTKEMEETLTVLDARIKKFVGAYGNV